MTPPSDAPGGDERFPVVPPPPEGVQQGGAPTPAGWSRQAQPWPAGGPGQWEAQAPPASAALGGALHPAAIGVWSATQVGAIVVLFVLNPASVFFALPFAVALVISSVVRWTRFRWQLEDTSLVIEKGLINRQRRVIPLERIQSVDIVRRLSHRLFGVVGVQIEAIGGGETEGQLDALSPAVATRLRAAVLAGRARARGEAPQPSAAEDAAMAGAAAGGAMVGSAADTGRLLATTSPRKLLTAGFTEANGTLIAGLVGLGWQFGGDRIEELAERLPTLLAGNTVLVATIAIIVIAVLLLVAAQFLAFWGFTLHRDDEELRIRRGLLEQRFDTIPLRRLQAVRIEENLPRRLIGRAAVKADVAGKPGGGSGGTDTLLPIGTAEEARELAEAVLGLPGIASLSLAPMPRRARTRRLFRAVATVVVPTVPLAVLVDPLFLIALLLLVPALGAAEAAYRSLGHAERDDVIVVRAGWWVRRTAFVPSSRLQALAVDQTLLQRWRRLGTLRLGIARSPGLWSGPQMIDLDRDVAMAILGDLAPVASQSRRLSTGRDAAPRRDEATAT